MEDVRGDPSTVAIVFCFVFFCLFVFFWCRFPVDFKAPLNFFVPSLDSIHEKKSLIALSFFVVFSRGSLADFLFHRIFFFPRFLNDDEFPFAPMEEPP